jgi:hypothetical protein
MRCLSGSGQGVSLGFGGRRVLTRFGARLRTTVSRLAPTALRAAGPSFMIVVAGVGYLRRTYHDHESGRLGAAETR